MYKKMSLLQITISKYGILQYDLLKMMINEDPSKRPTTLGIKARPPLQNHEVTKGYNVDNDSKWHFELPQLIRNSSMTSSSSAEFPEIIS